MASVHQKQPFPKVAVSALPGPEWISWFVMDKLFSPWLFATGDSEQAANAAARVNTEQ
jgi:hypothetical protein